MIKALSVAATGLEAQQASIEAISNDIANVNTDGYKRSRTEFQDLMYETNRAPGTMLGSSVQAPVGVQSGMGVKVGATHKIFEQGTARMTYHPYDLLIDGHGFFPVKTPQGEVAYTRAGAFHVDRNGTFMLGNGATLVPQISIPPNAINVIVDGTGEVRVSLPGNGETVIGQIQLVTFQNEQGLLAMGNGLYRPTVASGTPLTGVPGENGMGVLQQGQLEGSNVNVATSMVDMITAQRAYEMNTKVMGVADQMMGATANIK